MERLIKTGAVAPKQAAQVEMSRLGVGFEKLDRGAFDPEKAYDKIAALGVKWARIQSGWAKTERQKGVYDFQWLDTIVDNLLRRGMIPWICLCYGNGLYDDTAAKMFGAVGCPPIHSAEAEAAWAAYVSALTAHYKGRVTHYEIWNEPDGKWCWKHGPSGTEYGRFAVETARAVRQGDPDAYVIGGAVCFRDISYINAAFDAGMGPYIDGLSFHEYTADETLVFDRVKSLRAVCALHGCPDIQIIQGESGSQSRRGGAGALSGGAWTPARQAKQLLRHTVADLLADVLFSSYFSSLDMFEALNGTIDDAASYKDFAYFGVLGADFDQTGAATGSYTPKPSYYALQHLAAVFAGAFTPCDLPMTLHVEDSPLLFHHNCSDAPTLQKGGFMRANGSYAYAYWNATDLMTTSFSSYLTLETALDISKLRLIDLMDGQIYSLPTEMLERKEGGTVIHDLPVKDYPLLLTFGDFQI